jgi:hypothetical protein
MAKGEWYVPEGKLNAELRQVVPAEDTIVYTTAALVKQRSRGPATRIGELAITNRGVGYYVKGQVLKSGLQGLRGGPIREYIRFDRIEHIESKGTTVLIRVSPPVDVNGPEDEIELTADQSKPYEDLATFKRRRGQFGPTLEHTLFLYRTGQAVSPLLQPSPPVPVPMPQPPTGGRRAVYCPRCGTFLEDPAEFCENCGARLAQ